MLHGVKVPRLNLALTERLRDPFHRYDMSQRRGFVYPGREDDRGVGQGQSMSFFGLIGYARKHGERCLQHVETNKITEKHMPTVRYSGEIAVE